jgi:beta-phosphoglucomutase
MSEKWGLIFDVDGVIVDTEALNARATARMFQEVHNLQVRLEDFLPFIGKGDERYVEGVAENYGVTIDTDAAIRRRAEIFFDLLGGKPLPALPGLLDLIKAARESGRVTLAIATSGRKDKQLPVIEGAGLDLDWFDAVITGEDVKHKKPSPEIYLLAAQRLKLTPERCLVVEDAPAGVEAAKAAGMSCLALLTSAPREQLAAADWIVQDFTEVDLSRLESLTTEAPRSRQP